MALLNNQMVAYPKLDPDNSQLLETNLPSPCLTGSMLIWGRGPQMGFDWLRITNGKISLNQP